MRHLPTWSRAFGIALSLLLINLFWNNPLQEMTGGGTLAFLAFNLGPSILAVGWIGAAGR